LEKSEGQVMRKSNFALRVQPSLLEEARQAAKQEGVALNQLINVALAEKLSAMRMQTHIANRIARANIPEALAVLATLGVGGPVIPGDELDA
jgi:hypothetical protein